jgi:hypothetical protein
VNCPPVGIHQRTEANILDRLTALAKMQPDHQVAERLNAEGLRTRTGKKWTYARVHSMRKQHAIPTGCPLVPHPETKRADGFVSSKVAAESLQISPSLVNLWVTHGVLRHDQRVAASKVWVQLSEEDFARLTGASPEARSLPTLKSVREQNGLSLHELWHQISLGHYLPYRVRRGRTWEWRLKKVSPSDTPQPTALIRRSRKGKPPYE